jgi:hypothetical protein
MIEHITFLLYLITFLVSNIGYGLLFSKFFYKNFYNLNYGYLGIIGFFSITIIAYLTSFFTAHNFFHNFTLHFIGLAFFIVNFVKDLEVNLPQIKKLFSITLVLLIGIYVFKNHDDFAYYHLTYALNLSESKLIIGTGLFSHGFRTSSSIFQYHSTLYLPYIKYFLFHSGPFYILIYFNYIILSKLIHKYQNNQFDIIYFFSLLNFCFVNVVFYRLAEHGTDRSAQILLFLNFIIFFEIYFIEKNKEKKSILLSFLLLSTFLAASMKVLFIIYTIIIPIVLLQKNFYKIYLVKKNIIILIIVSLSFSLNLSSNFFNTGCLVYPEEKTCFFDKFDWSLSKKEVNRMSIHYEWWAKAGGGPGYVSEIEPKNYIKNFVWFKNWIDRHFFNKVSDTLLGIIFIAFLNFLLFKGKKKKKFKLRNFFLVNTILGFLFLEWFLKHPSMRYGGYVLFALPIFIFTSRNLEKYDIKKKKIYSMSLLLIILTFSIYNIRNFVRIQKESNNYYSGYNLLKSPYFYVPNVQVNTVYNKNGFKIYTPIKSMCWNAPTPCSYRKSVNIKEWKGYKVIQRKQD